MSFDATFEVVGNIEAKLNPVQNIDAKFGEMYESGGVDVEPLSVTENGTYTAPTGKAYSPVSVNVASGVDVSDTTAVAGDVRNGKKFHLANGSLATGTMVTDWSWMGKEPEWVSTLYSSDIALKDTKYATWTPSTSESNMLSSVTLTPVTIDLANYVYHVIIRTDMTVVYQPGTTLKSAITRVVSNGRATLYRSPKEYVDWHDREITYNRASSWSGLVVKEYYNASGTKTGDYTLNGIYPQYSGIGTISLTSTSSDTPNITVKTPSLRAKTNTASFSAASAAAVDQNNTVYKCRVDLWRAKHTWSQEQQYIEAIDLLYNPLT